MPAVGPAEERHQRREIEREFEGLHRRLLELADRVVRGADDEPSAQLLADVLQECSATVEELEVSSEEIQAQFEASQNARFRIEQEAQHYRDLFDAAPDGYLVTDEHGTILEANRAAAQLLNVPSRLLVSKPFVVFVDPADRRTVLGALNRVVHDERVATEECEVRFAPPDRPDGTGFPGSVHIAAPTPAPGQPRTARWLIRDVTRRVAAEEALAHKGEQYRLIAASVCDAVITTDSADRVVFASPSATTVFGREPRQLEGNEVSHLIHREDWLALAALEGQAMGGEPHASGVLRVVGDSRGAISMEVVVVQMHDYSGAPAGLCYTFREVHEREHSRLALQAALTREREAAMALREADAAKDALLLAASHDLSSPVAAVAGLADLLVQHPDLPDGEVRRMAEGVAAAGAQLRAILTNLLDAERVLGGHLVVRSHPTDLHAIVVGTVQAHGLPAACVRPARGPVLAEMDAGLTARIVDNVVGNALRHTPPGTPVRVSLERTDHQVVLSVADRGPGIPDDLKEEVFEPFLRRSTRSGGLGLGLFVVRRFAELQGGRSWVEDTEGGGATVRVTLPAVQLAGRPADRLTG